MKLLSAILISRQSRQSRQHAGRKYSTNAFSLPFHLSYQGVVMPGRQFFQGVFIVILSILGLWILHPAVTSAATDPAASDDGMEVLTRGPIHEAFMDVSVNEATPAVVISHSVPEPINEVPPDYRPEGDNVQWISGYWSWDEDQNDFIWVSGIWRDVPPGRQWIPGYWMAVEGGSRFVSGYWTDIEQTETVYLPPPPEPLPGVPISSAVSSDALWIDGHWLWSGNGYAWQAGYWLRQRPDMIWIPAHYVWTPRGFVFVRGYWDYQFDRRGVLFAPRYYPRASYRSYDYYHTPSIALSIDSIFLSLFIRKNHHHYYFGDYFDNRYERRGFLPWYSRHATRYGHDPCYRSYRWHQLRENRQWEHNYHQQYQFRRDHRETRPPILYRSQAGQYSDRLLSPPDQVLGRPLAEVVERRDQPLRFTRLNQDHKRDFQTRERRMATFQAERRDIEIAPDMERRTGKGGDLNRPERVQLSVSPIVDRSGRDNISGRRQAGSQDHRRHGLRQQTLNAPRDRQQEVSQPVRPVFTSRDNDQTQARQLKKQQRKVEEKRHIRPQTTQSIRPSQRVTDQPASQPQFSRQFSQQKNEPGRVESRRFVQPRVEPQRTRLREVKDQPGFQPRLQQQSRSIQQMEDRSHGRFRDYRQSDQFRKVETRRVDQPRMTEKRGQHRRVESQADLRPRVDRQGIRSSRFTDQKSGSSGTNRFMRNPQKYEDQLRGQAQDSDRKGKREKRGREHRRNNNR